ncbi:hypothetical protein Sango_2053800 [Sesamum angolense]|uniref:Endonuclease/exonuclease/phosphatase domain-containing protein n=1 Tax=Sesamum angolense TaxID=2727404 RepID=A0AAE1WG43_9LAMI|nr:hypothetical protein Sango_2053800 [Sesamum angolense]
MCHDQSLLVECRGLESKRPSTLGAISNSRKQSGPVWVIGNESGSGERTEDLDGVHEEPWVVMGDFNSVLDQSEISGHSSAQTLTMADYGQCLLETCLTTMPMKGAWFSWHNCGEGQWNLWKRLDRVLLNEAWPEACQIASMFVACLGPWITPH